MKTTYTTIQVPWSVTTQIQDGRGNFKQLNIQGDATIKVDDYYKSFFESNARAILSNYFTAQTELFGWQSLTPENEPSFNPRIAECVKGIEIEKAGLILVREFDLAPSFKKGGKDLHFKKTDNGKTLYENLDLMSKYVPGYLSQPGNKE